MYLTTLVLKNERRNEKTKLAASLWWKRMTGMMTHRSSFRSRRNRRTETQRRWDRRQALHRQCDAEQLLPPGEPWPPDTAAVKSCHMTAADIARDDVIMGTRSADTVYFRERHRLLDWRLQNYTVQTTRQLLFLYLCWFRLNVSGNVPVL